MNINIENQREIDAFFDELLPLLPKTNLREPPAPSQQLLNLAKQAAQAHQDYLLDNGLYHEKIIALAADDGCYENASIKFENLGGEWSLTREKIPDDNAWQILKFKCCEDQIQKFHGKYIQVLIADTLYDLGEIDRRGVAETEIPYGLDFQQLKDVYFRNQIDKK
ncbi:hypothetical protein DOJK_02161 [Patescibacteria group bacterium]|nr:hypothetical protein DOJK_02161 [Patescibacteria group bacterium]